MKISTNASERTHRISRRGLLTGSAALAASGALLEPGVSRAAGRAPKRVVRLAHMTDVHVQPELGAAQGLAKALHHMQDRPDPPQLVLFGGDNVMNVDSDEGAQRAELQLKVWKRTLQNELSLPFRTCIGNHDVLELKQREGKQWAVDAYELPGRYYHFDQAGWRFVVLDSTQPVPGGYKGRLDDEQFEWLAALLGDTPSDTHVLLLSHIPILAACAYFDGDNEESGNWIVPGAWMHIDARKIKDLFHRHKNVKLCLSGHIHLIDQLRYNDTWYCCNGAVSGGWWKGPNQECATGYGLVDLFADGSFRNQYVAYPWQPRG